MSFMKKNQNTWCPTHGYTDEEPCAENRKSELSSLQGQITYTICADKQPLQFQSKTDKENLKNIGH